ncbi:NACHT domain-containing protein [Asticcacaulis sp.]|uniref:NACHT domain-containing protein n=1 Tax=Asticcacaulis sp. TaxID=1872648 RepID=UPI003F7BC736
MKLAPGDILQLEVAEDYAVIAREPQAADSVLRSVQVKDTINSGRVTLNSPGVKAAIENLWKLRVSNQGRDVYLTYLTTSEIGKEKEQPLASGIPGLEAWMNISDGHGDLSALRCALVGRFPAGDLGTFLRDSSDAELFRQLISKLVFACGMPDSEALEASGRKALRLRRDEVQSTSEAAELAYDFLLCDIFRVAIRPSDRTLDAEDFLNSFRKATQSYLGSQTFQDLLSLIASPPSAAATQQAYADAMTTSQGMAAWPSVIKGQHIPRPELEILLRRLKEKPNGRTLVIGDAGVGKSALFAELTQTLQKDGIAVFAIKADFLPATVANVADLTRELGCKAPIDEEIVLLARDGPVVILIDQLDAVSEVMDFKSDRMTALLQLVNRFSSYDRQHLPIHILVSSRPFEAAHDARFEMLKAQSVTLAPPSGEAIKVLLSALSLRNDLPADVLEILRRPFALKLYVDIVSRSNTPIDFAESTLLDRWLAAAKLGSVSERETVMRFLKRLAADMTEAEELWLPTDRYIEDDRAINFAVASGLLVRREDKLGFSHQSWLDDFQAKAFGTAEQLCTYAWARQDGLFSRASILRGLQRLRRNHVTSYAAAIDKLLFSEKTRRHLKHLVVDVFSNQDNPIACEVAAIHHLLDDDFALARRGLYNLRTYWTAWRRDVLPSLPGIMNEPELRWPAILLLISEASVDTDAVLRMISFNWLNVDHDHDVFQVFCRSGIWSPQVSARVRQIFTRSGSANFELEGYIANLVDAGQPIHAIDLVGIFLQSASTTTWLRDGIYGLATLAENNPWHFAEVVLPWFVHQALAGMKDVNPYRATYPSSSTLNWDWDHDDRPDKIYTALRRALDQIAQDQPEAFYELISPYLTVDVDQVQSLLMETMAAGASVLATRALDLLLSDPRRLYCGNAHRTDTCNVGRLTHGWSSQVLIEAIAPHLETTELTRLVEYIEGWNIYATEAVHREEERSIRLQRMRWADEHRLELLDKLPDGVILGRRLRQLNEWRLQQPSFSSNSRHLGMAQVVGSPLGADKMSKASNADIFKLLDELNDQSDERTSYRRGLSGGVSQLSDAFGRFAQSHPTRAAEMASTWFVAGRHENAAGELVRQASESESVDVELVLTLIRDLDSKGFASKVWRTDAAWALRRLAQRAKGLSDGDISMLESWFLVDPIEVLERRIRRENLDHANARRNETQEKKAHSLIFGNRWGGILPQGNFTTMDALQAGFLLREPADVSGWLAALIRHVDRPEDPANWAAFLKFRAVDLYNHPDREEVQAFFGALFKKHPDILKLKRSIPTLWELRALFPPGTLAEAVRTWNGSEDRTFQQAAGEYAAGLEIVGEAIEDTTSMLQQILSGGTSPALIGALLVYAKAWQEAELHVKTTEVLARLIPGASGDQALAISTAFFNLREGIGLPRASTLIGAIAQNTAVLQACCLPYFFEQVQMLTSNPRHAELVMDTCEKIFDLDAARRNETGRGSSSAHLVSTAIALQRADGTIRTRAMDLYEALLDAGNSDADRAAIASLRRA